MNSPPVLEVSDLVISVTSGNVNASLVEGVTFAVGQGETLGLVGESGSGKSITMLSVIGLLPSEHLAIEQGSVRLAGTEISGLTEEEFRRIRGSQLAMVYQNPMTSLNPVMRVGEQIAEGLTVHGRSGSEADRAAIRALKTVHIPDPERVAEAYPHQLSGGMRQRVMIASATSMSPDLLILDEPTTALDVTIQQQIVLLVRELAEANKMAVVWITHDLGLLAGVADRVAVMYGGTIVEQGPADSMLRTPFHPYSRGLLDSVPEISGERGTLASIPGTPPSAFSMPPGCPFEPRCELAQPECQDPAPLRSSGPHTYRCWVVGGDQV